MAQPVIDTPTDAQRLQNARVLVALGELSEAESEIGELLEQEPEQLEALSFLAKIKHIRGELSLTVACMAQVEAKRASLLPAARQHLESMLRLAQDPARGAGEFVAVGQFQLVKKPTAYLALEEAFQLYTSRRPNEARSVCRQVAARYRDNDPEVYKLAVLAEAWICEMIGDLEAACEILQRLGEERGFETDLDRVLALVDLFERIGTAERLEAAANIYRYLERTIEPRRVLGRLALLHRRMGHHDEAARCEEQHLVAYRRSMHRPSFEDLLGAACRQYLPIEELRRIPSEPVEVPAERPARERAVASALCGELEHSRSLFDEHDALDLKYLGDIEAIEAGELSGAAIDCYGRALRADSVDLHVVGRLLDELEARPNDAISELFRSEPIGSRSLDLLEAAVHARPRDARLWRWLATLFATQPGAEDRTREFAERAEALEQAAKDAARVSGSSLAAAVYRFLGKAQGLIHEVWATRQMAETGHGGALQRDDVLGSLTDEMRNSVRNTFFAVRQYAQSKFPYSTRDILDYQYFYKVTKDDEPSGGVSAGLPTALAFLSVFLQRPVPSDLASTGTVVADAHDVLMLRPVGDIEVKVDAAYHRNLRTIIVPAANQPQLEQCSLVPRAVIREIVSYAASLDDAVKLAFGAEAFL
ncbi:MAG TPA: S16 family serine protease [Candidatus Polarisedimenticolaceae bacterium]|nr:S16 family serine protease [Candidatus Polarisedimenticolaceae bacterium]